MDKKKVIRGKELLTESSVLICGIVRDCEKKLSKNIPVIDCFCDLCREYNVIIFENDSVDGTKEVLINWTKRRPNVHISLNTISEEATIPQNDSNSKYYPYNTYKRISKMATYRNKYLEYIYKNKLKADFLIVVDLDVSSINLKGIFSSFGEDRYWDAITANGQAIALNLKKRYFDTYALFECGCENIPQTSELLIENQYKWGFMRKNMPLQRVYSAHGGLSIYKFESIKGLEYKVFPNYDDRIEVRCEHYSIYKQMAANGFNKVYINPSMIIKYRSITFSAVIKAIVKRIKHG